MTARTILWRRVDQPGHESARLWFDKADGQLSGTAIFLHDGQPCRLDYLVDCSLDSRTRSAKVGGWVGAKIIDISVSVDSVNRWWMNGKEVPSVEGCVDIDLNFSPSTNLLPIRRLGLAVGQEANVKAAWLRFPGFTLEPLEQVYSHTAPNTYLYRSGSFTKGLSVDEVGFVISYPDYWEFEGRS